MGNKPFELIKKILVKHISGDLIEKLPDKWEKIGDVLVISLHKKLNNYKQEIGQAYAYILKCKSVLNDIGGIIGDLRTPTVKIIYGSHNTETVHKENGVRYKLNPQRVMFSSGNMHERIRMGNISKEDETVVDLFAGIGYFTLPMAIHSKPKKIYACEINPISFDYLCENISLNNVINIVEPLKGDNRKIAPKNVAERVIMGYIGNTDKFIHTAFSCLKNNSGIIHFHDKYPNEIVPQKPMEIISKKAEEENLDIKLIKYSSVKSYAPSIDHYVFDIEVKEK